MRDVCPRRCVCVLRGWRERFAYEGSVYGAVEESFFFEMYQKQTKPRTNLVAAQALYKVHATKSRRLKGKQKHLSPQPLEEEEREGLLS